MLVSSQLDSCAQYWALHFIRNVGVVYLHSAYYAEKIGSGCVFLLIDLVEVVISVLSNKLKILFR